MPQVADLQALLTRAIEDSGKDFGVAWTHKETSFRLFVRHQSGNVLWRLFHGSGLSAQHSWSSGEKNLRSLWAQILAQCNDLASDTDGGAEEDATNGDEAAVRLSPTTIITRSRGRLEKDALNQLMQAPLPIKRAYLATAEPVAVKDLIERVGLPSEEVTFALRELIASGLLSIMTAESGASGSAMPTDFQFSEAVRARPTAFESQWFKTLGTPSEVMFDSIDEYDDTTVGRLFQITQTLMHSLQILCKNFAEEFNRVAVDKELHVTVSDVAEHSDRIFEKSAANPIEVKLLRWRASTPLWTLSGRARPGLVEFFLMPAANMLSLGHSEKDADLCFKIELRRSKDDFVWLTHNVPVSPEDLRHELRDCFAQLIHRTLTDLLAETSSYSGVDPFTPSAGLQSAMEKQNLAQKIVSQQEEIQRRIARDLHDAVIADVALLRQSITAEHNLDRAKVVSSLDAITSRLREICYDLSPSDLRDWGLQTTLEDLLDQVSQRTGAECSLACEIEIPELDTSVELHIFRVIQEALNNSAKYSGASSIVVTIESNAGWLTFTVSDNGKGFEAADLTGRTKDGGMGMSSMQERVELIKCLYPARLQLASEPGRGTKTTLLVKPQ